MVKGLEGAKALCIPHKYFCCIKCQHHHFISQMCTLCSFTQKTK